MLLLELSRVQKCCFHIPILFCFYFSFLKFFPLEIRSWAKNAQPARNCEPSRTEVRTWPSSLPEALVSYMAGRQLQASSDKDEPAQSWFRSEMTQARELLYMIFKEARDAIILEVLKIPTLEQFRQIMLWSCWLLKNRSLLPLLYIHA